jgi:KaiC/GvpD/RAD55 family RecA-like ATPase
MPPKKSSDPIMLEDCKALLTSIQDTLNGNGHEGMKSRMARIEENIESTSQVTRSNAEQLSALILVVTKLELTVAALDKSVTAHHKDKHFKDLLAQKSFWAYLISGFIALHIISTYVPFAWDWVMRLVGLPALVIPIQ